MPSMQKKTASALSCGFRSCQGFRALEVHTFVMTDPDNHDYTSEIRMHLPCVGPFLMENPGVKLEFVS
jgi:hypothetical protein